MSEIFKLCYLKNNVIEKIHVYSGENSDSTSSPNTQSMILEEGVGASVATVTPTFNESERSNININNIPVTYFDTEIYNDDTIETIKKKIIKNDNKSFEELYLFCSYKGKLNSLSNSLFTNSLDFTNNRS